MVTGIHQHEPTSILHSESGTRTTSAIERGEQTGILGENDGAYSKPIAGYAERSSMSPRLARWYAEMAEAAKAATPQKPDPSRQLVLPDSAYHDEDTRYHDKAEQFGGVVFMGD